MFLTKQTKKKNEKKEMMKRRPNELIHYVLKPAFDISSSCSHGHSVQSAIKVNK